MQGSKESKNQGFTELRKHAIQDRRQQVIMESSAQQIQKPISKQSSYGHALFNSSLLVFVAGINSLLMYLLLCL